MRFYVLKLDKTGTHHYYLNLIINVKSRAHDEDKNGLSRTEEVGITPCQTCLRSGINDNRTLDNRVITKKVNTFNGLYSGFPFWRGLNL